MSSNDKVVYLHNDKEGVVRYVGSGTEYRAYLNYANSGRGKRYAEFVEVNGKLEVEIFAKGLSKLQAEDLERELYDQNKDTILNARRPNSVKEMTKGIFEKFLYYDETSKSCLRWKTDIVDGVSKSDREAGSLSKSGRYYEVGFQGKLYYAHRIICVLHDLEVDGKVVDHIDRDRSNNKTDNLRVVSQKENCHNRGINSNNITNITGVSYCVRREQWVASWYEKRKQRHRAFLIKNFASPEEAFQAACEYRKQMVEIHYPNKE